MRFYKKGVYTPANGECTQEQRLYRLYVSVDGYSMDRVSHNGYYIFKFPFGTGYGMSGNMRFIKDSKNFWFTEGLCNLYNYQSVIVAANP